MLVAMDPEDMMPVDFDATAILPAVSYQGQRTDKPARQVVQSNPHPPKGKA
jgi:hypothetical protein